MSASPRVALVVLGTIILASSAYTAFNSFWVGAGATALAEEWRDMPQTIDDTMWNERFPGRPKPSGPDWLAQEIHGYFGARNSSVLIGSSLTTLCGGLVILISLFTKTPPAHRAG